MNDRSNPENKPLKATERVSNTKPKPRLFSQEELNSSPWGKFILFLNQSYDNFIPHNFDKQKRQLKIVEIQKKILTILESKQYQTWNNLLDNLDFNDYEYDIAENFCFHLSHKYSDDNIEKFLEKWENYLTNFVSLFEHYFNNIEAPDLVKLNQIADIIDQFNKSKERTFWFIILLPKFIDDNSKKILINCIGYQEIIKFGAFEDLKEFGYKLQKKFALTRTAIKDRTAQNLVQELGEVESKFKGEIQQLELKIKQLENELEETQRNSFQNAVYDLAKSLQDNQQQPVLSQLFILYKKLDNCLENNESLSPTDTLTYFITIESLLTAFKQLNISQFPEKIEGTFEITGEDLDNNKYNYTSGSQFVSKDDKKIVKCIAPGWKVDDRIVTPAKVEEA
ncbi:nucleotide exchange factor GrpE [Geminocystis herdmanii]|uniref:nucleotide exchange factor GrpE n=1 Tax=Geminocystis herdmanii TaxID=669359 RepID=UPI00034ACD46|nr:nucleotide exchange factor GrpE [Geminocystis herdmanii]